MAGKDITRLCISSPGVFLLQTLENILMRSGTNYLERHLLTDEVFVLLSGEARLVIGCDLSKTEMRIGNIYNVKKGVYHALLMEKDAKVLIVENHNTSRDNTEYYYFR